AASTRTDDKRAVRKRDDTRGLRGTGTGEGRVGDRTMPPGQVRCDPQLELGRALQRVPHRPPRWPLALSQPATTPPTAAAADDLTRLPDAIDITLERLTELDLAFLARLSG